jgi:tetratricopeptide (TPR) repeat protein
MNCLIDRVFRLAVVAALLLLTGCAGAATGEQPPAPALPVAATPPMQAQPGVTATPVTTVTGGDAAAHVNAGDAALKAKNLANAEQEYKAAIAIDTASADANFGLGNVYAQGGRLNEAQAAYQAALSANPNMVSAHANLGVAYYQMGQFAKAVEQYNLVLQVNPRDAETLYLLAAVRLQEKNYPEAEQLLLRARDIKPELPEVYYGLGTLYQMQGQKEQAVASFEKFLQIGPGQDPLAKGHAEQQLRQLKGQ